MLKRFRAGDTVADHDICVVGAGPVGIALALACEEQGLSVLLLESGQGSADSVAAMSASGHEVDPSRHATPDVAMCRGLGGTSHWWGGRCVAFDDVDFLPRAHVPDASWPLAHADVARWYPAAADFLGIGMAAFRSEIAPWNTLQGARFEDIERWTPVIDMGQRHRKRLHDSQRITVLLGATVVEIGLSDGGDVVRHVVFAHGKERQVLACRRLVLACGGVETTRLLLAMQANAPVPAVGGSALGRYYMGHLSGKIADIVLNDAADVAAHDFFKDAGSVYVRRRFSLPVDIQQYEKLLNVSFWADNPPFHAAAHRSGVLSMVWLALAIPLVGRRLVSEGVRLSHLGPRPLSWLPHVLNVLRAPIATLREILRIVSVRFFQTPAMPGFLVRNSAGRYALHFHAEQSPNVESRLTLSDTCDELGLPFLKIDLRFGAEDAESIVRSHELLDRALRDAGLARLEYYEADTTLRVNEVLRQATDGFHQIGSTRMGTDPANSVVDADCRVHGITNLFVASSSVFPSSGQANPTFVAVALALRLAHALANGTVPSETSNDEIRSSSCGITT